ncbi:hypothetical protein RDWZM_009528 [Blomia tropicalis]|uniref:Uncharacterized protein n=1 Tax=Blomia tropicalis TaxID=40697 RepID=A0A9Q0M332_BLOTA|nr:hypothetical protein RDWZM_009528 [Blomia tropicalis]
MFQDEEDLLQILDDQNKIPRSSNRRSSKLRSDGTFIISNQKLNTYSPQLGFKSLEIDGLSCNNKNVLPNSQVDSNSNDNNVEKARSKLRNNESLTRVLSKYYDKEVKEDYQTVVNTAVNRLGIISIKHNSLGLDKNLYNNCYNSTKIGSDQPSLLEFWKNKSNENELINDENDEDNHTVHETTMIIVNSSDSDNMDIDMENKTIETSPSSSQDDNDTDDVGGLFKPMLQENEQCSDTAQFSFEIEPATTDKNPQPLSMNNQHEKVEQIKPVDTILNEEGIEFGNNVDKSGMQENTKINESKSVSVATEIGSASTDKKIASPPMKRPYDFTLMNALLPETKKVSKQINRSLMSFRASTNLNMTTSPLSKASISLANNKTINRRIETTSIPLNVSKQTFNAKTSIVNQNVKNCIELNFNNSQNENQNLDTSLQNVDTLIKKCVRKSCGFDLTEKLRMKSKQLIEERKQCDKSKHETQNHATNVKDSFSSKLDYYEISKNRALKRFNARTSNHPIYHSISNLDYKAIHIRIYSLDSNEFIIRFLWGTVEVRINFNDDCEPIRPMSINIVSLLNQKPIQYEEMRGLYNDQNRPLFDGDDMFLRFEEKHRPILQMGHDYILRHFHERYPQLTKMYANSNRLLELLTELSSIANTARSLTNEVRDIYSAVITELLPSVEDKFSLSIKFLGAYVDTNVDMVISFVPYNYPDEVIHPVIIVPEGEEELYEMENFKAELLNVKNGELHYLYRLVNTAHSYIIRIEIKYVNNID